MTALNNEEPKHLGPRIRRRARAVPLALSHWAAAKRSLAVAVVHALYALAIAVKDAAELLPDDLA